jgi:hypothetical protein
MQKLAQFIGAAFKFWLSKGAERQAAKQEAGD